MFSNTPESKQFVFIPFRWRNSEDGSLSRDTPHQTHWVQISNRYMRSEIVRVFGPASLSNLGPGFDTLGLCLTGLGDVVEARRSEHPGVSIKLDSCGEQTGIPVDPLLNTAGVAALELLKKLGTSEGVHLFIEKGFVAGSGIGSSAACAAAAAWAVNILFDRPFEKDELLDVVLSGEAVASGARHGDNVLPSLLGGTILVSSKNPTRYRRIKVARPFWVALLLPELKVLTKQARSMLPGEVPLQAAVIQASALAFMIAALMEGDLKEAGYWMMQDQLAEPVRSQLVPCYSVVKTAALRHGALGCALTGSGPAMFSITEDEPTARIVMNEMQMAATSLGIKGAGFVSQVNEQGAAVLSSSVEQQNR